MVPTPDGSNVTVMYIGGVLRTEVDTAKLRPFGMGPTCNWCMGPEPVLLDTNYTICRVDEWPFGTVAIGSSCDGQLYPGAVDRVNLYNVLISFSQLEYPSSDEIGEPIARATHRSAKQGDVTGQGGRQSRGC